MPQSLSSILIHLIFSTKNREPFLTREIDAELYPYIASIFKAMKSPALIISGTSDHLHTLFSLARVVTIADLVEEDSVQGRRSFVACPWLSYFAPLALGRTLAEDPFQERIHVIGVICGCKLTITSAINTFCRP
jgi:hypothetical protein